MLELGLAYQVWHHGCCHLPALLAAPKHFHGHLVRVSLTKKEANGPKISPLAHSWLGQDHKEATSSEVLQPVGVFGSLPTPRRCFSAQPVTFW